MFSNRIHTLARDHRRMKRRCIERCQCEEYREAYVEYGEAYIEYGEAPMRGVCVSACMLAPVLRKRHHREREAS